MERISTLSKQITSNKTKSGASKKSPNDVVICASFRTPLTKSKKGGLKDTPCESLIVPLLQHILKTTKLDPKLVEDVIVGNVLQPGAGVAQIKMALFLAGFPESTSAVAINRMCSSGIEAISMIANKIQAGVIDIGIGAGVEQMSMYDMQASVDPEKLSESIFDNEGARNCLIPMGQTSENVAQKYGITRAQQDAFAVESQNRASKAQKTGLFKDEIVPVKTQVKDKEGNATDVVVTEDDGIRATTIESLTKLKPAFSKTGTTTAGNSSQVTDGAGACLLARRSVAEKLGLPIIAKYVAYSVVGVPPEIMGVGPAFAIPHVLKKAGLTVDDIDVFEVNEAFASQAIYCCQKLGLDMKKVNPKGGAIALGHPLGCTGARQMATLLPELKRTNGRYGVISMCIGTGMGAAAVIERE